MVTVSTQHRNEKPGIETGATLPSSMSTLIPKTIKAAAHQLQTVSNNIVGMFADDDDS